MRLLRKIINFVKSNKTNNELVNSCVKNFVIRRQPKAYQGNKTFKSEAAKNNYISELKKSLNQFNTLDFIMEDDLYGVVYYFQKKITGTDADNISKPIWDCLKNILYKDDKQIKLRIAGIIDISKGDLNIFDFTNIRSEIMYELLDAFDQADHFIYVECGKLDSSMYKFNIGYNENRTKVF